MKNTNLILAFIFSVSTSCSLHAQPTDKIIFDGLRNTSPAPMVSGLSNTSGNSSEVKPVPTALEKINDSFGKSNKMPKIKLPKIDFKKWKPWKKKETPKTTPDKPAAKPPANAFMEQIRGFQEFKGLFDIYQKDTKYLMAIKPDQLNKDFLFSSTMERGTGERGMYASLMHGNFVFYLQKFGKTIQFVKKNTKFRADPNTPAGRAVETSFQDSILMAGKIISAPHPDTKSILIEMAPIFLSDLEGMGDEFSEIYKTRYYLDPGKSYFDSVESFPKNTEILTRLLFKTDGPISSPTSALPSKKSVGIGMRYSLTAMPESGFEPREADDRVGYFLETYQDLDQNEGDPNVSLINRWRLEKQDPNAPVSDVKEPVVFYLENTIPEEYRPAIIGGIMAWNKAFESIGLRNAVVVKVQPDDADWKAGDVRYNTIRWFYGPDASFAMGPSRINPFTGEIFNASVSISDNIVRNATDYFEYYDPAGKEDASVPVDPSRNYTRELQRDYALAMASLEATGQATPEKKQELMDQYLRWLACHEVGHTLGLRHNFKASALYSMDEINNGSENIASSVMDYTPINIAPEGAQQGAYSQANLGPYDYWVIKYGYSPFPPGMSDQEKRKKLSAIAAEAAKKEELAYATDEDRRYGNDPRVAAFDLGSDPLEYRTQQINRAKVIFDHLETQNPGEGQAYDKFRVNFNVAFDTYEEGVYTASRYLGGMDYSRQHSGDTQARDPFEPVSAQKQREALEFITENVFSEGSLEFSPALIRKLSPRAEPKVARRSMSPTHFPIDLAVSNLQAYSLQKVYDTDTLQRIRDNEMMTDGNKDTFTITELFDTTRKSIWSELDDRSNITTQRRALQQKHVNELIGLMNSPLDFPSDTRALVRNDLSTLSAGIESALKSKKLDPATQIHLEAAQAKINAALYPYPTITRGR
ncbi:zinc-dependent metalloprotease [Elusimicrobiota bacterium]